MDEQHQPGEDGATKRRLITWQAMQWALEQPQFDRILREALKQYPAEQIKQELRSVGISDEQIAQAFARIGHKGK